MFINFHNFSLIFIVEACIVVEACLVVKACRVVKDVYLRGLKKKPILGPPSLGVLFYRPFLLLMYL